MSLCRSLFLDSPRRKWMLTSAPSGGQVREQKQRWKQEARRIHACILTFSLSVESDPRRASKHEEPDMIVPDHRILYPAH